MELVGVTVNRYNYKIKSAIEKGIKTYALQDSFGIERVEASGQLHDFLSSSDIVVDCTPKGVGSKNKIRYQKAGLKAIFQGGENFDVGKSFVAQCNYEVVSCNTTGLCRTLHAIDRAFGIKMVHATMIRRAADPWDIHHGPINSIVPIFELPSHHGPDVRTVLPHLEVFTTSLSVPTTIMHMHSVTVDLKEEIKAHEAVDLFNSTTRVRIVSNLDGIRSTAEIIEYAKDMGRNRGDMPEICIWEETVGVFGNKLFYLQAVHQESNVIPENIDAIRAMTKLCGKEESISKTNESLGII